MDCFLYEPVVTYSCHGFIAFLSSSLPLLPPNSGLFHLPLHPRSFFLYIYYIVLSKLNYINEAGRIEWLFFLCVVGFGLERDPLLGENATFLLGYTSHPLGHLGQ